jgi:hypothetical protein
MQGERTVVRIFINAEGGYEVQTLSSGLSFDEVMRLIGFLNYTAGMLCKVVDAVGVDGDKVNNIRKLLD